MADRTASPGQALRYTEQLNLLWEALDKANDPAGAQVLEDLMDTVKTALASPDGTTAGSLRLAIRRWRAGDE